MSDIAFYAFAALTAGCALGVVFNRNSVHAAFCLLLSLLGVAGLFALLQAYLLAALLVLVYAGAIVALFVFIVMLLGMQGGEKSPFKGFSFVLATFGFFLLLAGIAGTFGTDAFPPPPDADVPALGAQLKLYAYQLFTTYLLPVQVVGFLLLISMIGVIVISKKDVPAPKPQPLDKSAA
jgi:NADH-quinone oxidoreductase subunit J